MIAALRRCTRRWHRDERGQLGGAEAIPLGFLLLVVSSLLAANAWAVIDAKSAARAAAREAVRTFVESSGGTAGATAAEAVAIAAIDGHGLDPDRVRVPIRPSIEGGAFERCAVVTIRVVYEVPAIPLPWIGGFGDGIDAAASHTEVVDPLRNDVPGVATCVG